MPASRAPVAFDAVPAGHCEQTALPSESEKEPGAQGAQLADELPPGRARAVPAGQNTSHTEAPLCAVQLPAGQRMHDTRDGTGEYEPAGHGMFRVAPGQE